MYNTVYANLKEVNYLLDGESTHVGEVSDVFQTHRVIWIMLST